jgi:corrinoid protein of di/trimethylamine methyltransferase
MTHRERMLRAAQGEMADRIPFAPRLDLWYTPNKIRGTLPPEHKDHTIDEISRTEGWAFHKIVPEFMAGEPEEILDRGLNIYRVKECPYRAELPEDVERTITREGTRTKVEYRTPIGRVGCVLIYTEEMKAAGATLIWLEEHILKRPEDYKILGYIYRHMKITPDYQRFQSWINSVGDEGLACAQGSPNASPMHLIQRDLLDATQFYYHFRDYPKEMMGLVEDLEPFFQRILAVTADSPAEVVQWGANYDDMITYPALFQEHFLPWLRKASATLKQKGKIPLSHCDGENFGLMDLILESGIGIAESVCPYPMTKVTIAEYYRRWRPRITIFGGIPANLLLEDSTSDEDFEKYMDLAFQSIVPGDHFIFGVADTVPPNAKFERLRRIGFLIEERGKLPLQAGAARVLSAEMISRIVERVSPVKIPLKKEFPEIREALAGGDQIAIQALVKKALEEGIPAGMILQKGLIPAMESIGEKFKSGEIFIPEVLLSARAMNEGLAVLEPFLAESGTQAFGTVLIGTVRGDMHDIGKNLVSVMLKGVGFKVHDLGVDVPNDVFIQKIKESNPDVLALSALLTTTMPHMKEVIEAMKRAGLREKVKIIIGGAPVNQTFAEYIGADGYGGDAGDAVALVKKLLDREVGSAEKF